MGGKGSEGRGGGRIPAISGTPPVRWSESSGDLKREKAFAPASVSSFSYVTPQVRLKVTLVKSPCDVALYALLFSQVHQIHNCLVLPSPLSGLSPEPSAKGGITNVSPLLLKYRDWAEPD